MAKVLVIAPFYSVPQTSGGSIRVANILKNLVLAGHDTNLLYFRDQLIESNEEKSYIADKINFHFWPNRIAVSRKPFFKRMAVYAKAMRNQESLKGPIQYPLGGKIREKLAQFIEREKFDVVIIEFTWLAHFAKFVKREFPKVKIILDSHNVESDYERQESHKLNFISRIFMDKFAGYLEREEFEAIKLADTAICVSQSDKDKYVEFFGKKIESKMKVAPNGVDVMSYDRVQPFKKEGFDLIFVGWMRYPPNIRAVNFVVREVLPKLNNKISFAIVGGEPSEEVLGLSKNNHKVFVSGTVEDVKPYLKSAKIFIAPIFEGSGTRLKILEAFSAKIAVIASSKAVEGIDYQDGRDLLIAENAQEFARKVSELLSEPDKRASLARAGFELVREKYDWSKSLKNLVGEVTK